MVLCSRNFIRLFCSMDVTEFEPETIAEFENDELEPDEEFEEEVIREDDQVGGNIEQHVNIGLEFRQRVNRFNTEGAAFNVRFNDLENVANLNEFLIEVSIFCVLFPCFFAGYMNIALVYHTILYVINFRQYSMRSIK